MLRSEIRIFREYETMKTKEKKKALLESVLFKLYMLEKRRTQTKQNKTKQNKIKHTSHGGVDGNVGQREGDIIAQQHGAALQEGLERGQRGRLLRLGPLGGQAAGREIQP